jgi:RNA polymerase sigma-70 factor (ECF subfamily)
MIDFIVDSASTSRLAPHLRISEADGTKMIDRSEENMLAVDNLRNQENEADLLQRCRLRDREACNMLLERYNRRIYNTAYRILGEQASAEDALQETLLNVYRGLVNFRGDAQVSTWISRITVNVCLGLMRKGKHRRFVALEDELTRVLPADPTPYLDPEMHTSSGELGDLIARTFARMSAKHSKVVRLHDMEGYTIPEIARLIRCPVGTVKSRLFYGRQEFKEVFSSIQRPASHKPTVH